MITALFLSLFTLPRRYLLQLVQRLGSDQLLFGASTIDPSLGTVATILQQCLLQLAYSSIGIRTLRAYRFFVLIVDNVLIPFLLLMSVGAKLGNENTLTWTDVVESSVL